MDEETQAEQQQQQIQQPMHEEERREEQNNAAPAAPVEAERAADPLEANIHRLRDEEFVELNVSLVHADPAFSYAYGSLHLQHDSQRVRESRKKSGRKRMAQTLKTVDNHFMQVRRTRRAELSAKVNNISTEELVERTALDLMFMTEDRKQAENREKKRPVRQDVTGYDRRVNAKRFRKAADGEKARNSAQKDVENLVNNLCRDILMDPKSVELADERLEEYTNAYYFTQKYVTEIPAMKLAAARQDLEADRITEEQYAGKKKEVAKLEQFLMLQKTYALNCTPQVIETRNTLRAWRVAKVQIEDESGGHPNDYQQEMLRVIDRKITELQNVYSAQWHGLETCNDKMDQPKNQAIMQAQKELGRLRREMKRNGITDEEKEALEQQGRAVIENFTYEGPVEG